jgi:hypothetical protein
MKWWTILFLALAMPALADDMVTISKARLQELERAEAELKKLKGEFNSATAESAKLKKQHQEDLAKLAAAPQPAAITHVSPEMASLPALRDGDVVDAMDLANYYRSDAAAANQRYRKHKLKVQGEIASFEKPVLTREYKLIFKTADREIKVVCDVYPPDKFKAVFPTKNGSELVGLAVNETRYPIAKVGDVVTVLGECRGLNDSAVRLGGCELQPAQ